MASISLMCTSVNNYNNMKTRKLIRILCARESHKGCQSWDKKCKEVQRKMGEHTINKYFRKTKDCNKKRFLHSRTCPYSHLSRSLYSQGKLVLQYLKIKPENHLNPTANSGELVPPDQAQAHESSQVGSGSFMHADHGDEKTLIQVPPLDFD